MSHDLKPYSVYLDGVKEEGAALVFAENNHQARKLAWQTLSSRFDLARWIDVRAKRLPWTPHLLGQMVKNGPHAIESPNAREHCGMWDSVPPEDCPTCAEGW